MHPSVMAFVAQTVTRHGLVGRPVLDVGSLNVNGSVRELFHGPYLGVDMRPGPGVDQVCNAHNLWSLTRRFDVIVCLEMLEHDDAPWLSLAAMRRVISPDGILVLTCRGYDQRGCFPVHEHPGDLWRFSVQGVRRLLQQTGWAPESVEADPECPGVFALAKAV